jgi:DeoR/GlpR family transcriptional regulator of sugar metabolism
VRRVREGAQLPEERTGGGEKTAENALEGLLERGQRREVTAAATACDRTARVIDLHEDRAAAGERYLDDAGHRLVPLRLCWDVVIGRIAVGRGGETPLRYPHERLCLRPDATTGGRPRGPDADVRYVARRDLLYSSRDFTGVSPGEDGAAPARASDRRRALIRDRVIAAGSVRIDDLAHEHDVTVMTIHRDLNALEAEGWLHKIRGGATVDTSALIDTTVRHRLTDKVAEKRAIARVALEHIGKGEVVLVDDSTTALRLAELLPERGPLTVVTNFLMAINALAGKPGIELIALGGSYNATYDAFHGLHVREAVAKLRADVLVMSTTAVLDGFLYHKSEETILIRHAMMAAAARKVLLADHSKFRRRATHQLAPITDFDLVIVDAATDAGDVAGLRDRGVEVEVAPGAPGAA